MVIRQSIIQGLLLRSLQISASPTTFHDLNDLARLGRRASGHSRYEAANASMTTSRLLMGRQDDDDLNEFDPSDLTFITSLAAIGDSYSAGIGAGNRLGSVLDIFNPDSDYACSRYDHAYPYLVNTDERLGDPGGRKFQFLSCSGAVARDVLDEQIPKLDGNQQAILLSIGGNDAELTNILNQCIFQWAVLNQDQVTKAKLAALKEGIDWAADFDWGKLGRGCEGQLDRTAGIIDSAEFGRSLDSVLSAAKSKLAPGGVIYQTGYAKFWAEDLTTQCDSVSWSTWIYKTFNLFQAEQKLTVAHRQRMNELVDAVNSKLAAAVERAGSNVVFVNYDKYVGQFGGRYCEAGVDESTTESNTRIGLMFYELNTFDPLGSSPWKRSTDGPLNGTFEGDLDQFAEITILMDPNADLTHESSIEPAQASLVQNIDVQELDVQVPNILPDGYGRVFHPRVLLHELIAELVIYEMVNRHMLDSGKDAVPETLTIDSCPYFPSSPYVLKYKGTAPGKPVKPGTELRILCVGDSITVGFLSDQDGGDGNGYRLRLRDDLSADKVVFAGSESAVTMQDGYFAAWSGKTLHYIADHIGPSLEQRPNVVLIHGGTNDMNPNPAISTEGNDPAGAASRLGDLVDQVLSACPDAVVLVAMIIDTCDPNQSPRTRQYQQIIPSAVVKPRRDAGKHVLAVDFASTFSTAMLRDCIHPTNDGYHVFGDYWYDFVAQIPKDWIKDPVGPDPERNGIDENGGLDRDIPPPDWGPSPALQRGLDMAAAADTAGKGGRKICSTTPHWLGTGQIALGLGHNGGWHYEKNWVSAGEVASGLGRDPRYVRLQDMNGDGKADYVWLDPDTGMIICWLNNLPDPWSPAGTNDSIIGSGAARAEKVFLADMNGDGLDDYMVITPSTGAVHIWWNYGPDPDWVNGWKFVEGGEIAVGVPHANLATLRFPDINGDGRADYVYIGANGALGHWLNTGSQGGQDVLFVAQGGIATGATGPDISTLVFADLDGDGRDDYLLWDDIAGLTGFLNQPTRREGVPLYIDQGPPKTVADGISQSPSAIRLADLDGDGKDDYAYVDQNGALWVWWNRGEADTSMAMDGLRFADIDGDGLDDYVWLDPVSGAPTVYINKGIDSSDVLGWSWSALNGGRPIASGAAPASQVVFGDIDGDGLDDYLVLDPKTGALTLYLNGGPDPSSASQGWAWKPVGQIATGLGPGANVRIADIDGDGKDDYIFLHPQGRTTIYRNVYGNPGTTLQTEWQPMPDADASGIGQRPEEIAFVDINGDGKADYVWTPAVDGRTQVWFNNYPNKPTWLAQGEVAGGVGTSGSCVRWAKLQDTGRASYIAVDPNSGAIAAWLNGCDALGGDGPRPVKLPPDDSTCNSVGDCTEKWNCRPDQAMMCSGGGAFSGKCFCEQRSGLGKWALFNGTRVNETLVAKRAGS